MCGSGWHVLIVNEADCMTANAAYTWLDVLENLPPRCVVIFTTNDAHRLPRRLRDRCETIHFTGGMLLLRASLEEFARRVWREQVGLDDIDSFGPMVDENGDTSFRRLLQLMEPAVRAAKAGRTFRGQPEASIKPLTSDRSAAARKAWATRRRLSDRKLTTTNRGI